MSFKHRCLLLAALLALVHLLRFDVTEGPIVTDVRYYVYFAARMADGAVPHRDFFDNKTQLATVAGAALYATGRTLGVDPLIAMRVGYLALTGLAALLLFAIHRRLRDGSCVAGLLGMLCYLGFSLLGFLPAIGPLPKLLMGICASAAALLACRGWWTLAGLVGGIAFLDWQIGVLAGLGVFTAALCEREQRLAGATRVALGGIGALAAACAYFAWNGALGVAYRQVVLTSLARGESALAGKTFSARVLQILDSIDVACPGQTWLVVVGLAGMALYPLLLVRHRGEPVQRLVIALAVYHFGIVAFSLTDYQAYGDLFALLASLAFFAGVALNELYFALQALVARLVGPGDERPRRARWLVTMTAVLVAVLALRIGRPRLDITLPDKIAKGAASLTEQRSVARQITAQVAGRRAVFVNCPEQLYLTGSTNPLPFGFWNRATHNAFRLSPDEQSPEALGRLIESVRPDFVLCPTPRVGHDLVISGAFERVDVHADSGSYQVVLLRRR